MGSHAVRASAANPHFGLCCKFPSGRAGQRSAARRAHANEVRLLLGVIAYNLGNPLRRLVLPVAIQSSGFVSFTNASILFWHSVRKSVISPIPHREVDSGPGWR